MDSAAIRFQPLQVEYDETVTHSAAFEAAAEQRLRSDLDEIPDPFVFPTRGQPTSHTTSAWETDLAREEEEAPNSVANHPSALPTKVLRFPDLPRPNHQFLVLQKWEGTVAKISAKEFVASIRDLTNPSLPQEEATFLLDEVPDADRSLMTRGAIFYWAIGYEVNLSGQRKRVSTLRFRRLPGWTRSEIESVRQKAGKLEELFGDQDGSSRKATGT
jgi:hypothetical protein